MKIPFLTRDQQNSSPESEIEVTTNKKESLWDLIKFALILILIIVPFRMFVAQPFIVNGASMDPTFHEGDYLIVDELSYLLREPKRGEVIIFNNPANETQYFIKRVIGLPGETVQVQGNQVKVLDGEEQIVLDEPYLGSNGDRTKTLTLGEDEFFVMGDNRQVSYDSRMWGPLKEDKVRGRAFLRLFPPTVISYLPGNYEFEK